jgi:hypothetical protein
VCSLKQPRYRMRLRSTSTYRRRKVGLLEVTEAGATAVAHDLPHGRMEQTVEQPTTAPQHDQQSHVYSGLSFYSSSLWPTVLLPPIQN